MNNKQLEGASDNHLNNLAIQSTKNGNNSCHIRIADIQDCDKIRNLYRSTINKLTNNDFSTIQKQVWSGVAEDRSYWLHVLQTQHVIVAEYLDEVDESKNIVGFGSVKEQGYVEFLYVATQFQKIGIGRRILKELEKHCNRMHIEEIWVDVTSHSKGYFRRHGFVAEQSYTREFKNCTFSNVIMRKMFKTIVN